MDSAPPEPVVAQASQAADPGPRTSAAVEVFLVALRLGLSSFGGPIAHLGFFRREYVDRRRWLGETAFADLVALCQLLPGPASSQLGIAIGTQRAGPIGGVAAWLGFTLPSAVLMILFGLFAAGTDISGLGWVHGLKLAAVAIVAHAVWTLARTTAPDGPRRVLAAAATIGALLAPTALGQVLVIAAGAAIGWLWLDRARVDLEPVTSTRTESLPRRVGIGALVILAVLLVVLPVLARQLGGSFALVDALVRTGSLVFGGAHVVLPLLNAAVVEPGWVTDDRFLAGYAAAQALPGPLFSFAAFLGTVSLVGPGGVLGGVIALTAIFLPSFLLVFGALPFWDRLRASRAVRRALAGANAAVVGLLVAVLITPIWTSAVGSAADVLVVVAGLALLASGRVPALVVAAGCAVLGQLVLGSGT